MFERCSGCTSNYCPIPTDGPLSAEVLCYGERPGQQEEFAARKARDRGYFDSEGQNCFIGDAGEEFNNNYLRLAGLGRDRVRVGNTVLCGADGNKHPSERQARECAEFHIQRDIQETPRLKLVVLMGGVAASLVDGMDLEAEHGIPRWVEGWYGYTGWLVGMFHPAAGLHNSSMMIPLLEDWERLGRWLRDGMVLPDDPIMSSRIRTGWQWPVDQYPVKDFRLGRTRKDVIQYFADYPIQTFTSLIGADSERHGAQPFSLQVSRRPGTGLMVLEEDKAAVTELAWALSEDIKWQGGELTMHNADADLEPFLRHLRKLGIREFPYRDTMQEIYHTGMFLKQGLKIAALRVLGRRRASWEEVVGGASRQKLLEWLWEALIVAEGWRRLEPRVSEKTGKLLKPELIKHVAEQEVRHVTMHTSKSTEYESWKKISEFGWGDTDWFADLEREVGRPMPIKGIANCELAAAVEYGCQDASDHLELALALERLRGELERGWGVIEEDMDQWRVESNVRSAERPDRSPSIAVI